MTVVVPWLQSQLSAAGFLDELLILSHFLFGVLTVV